MTCDSCRQTWVFSLGNSNSKVNNSIKHLFLFVFAVFFSLWSIKISRNCRGRIYCHFVNVTFLQFLNSSACTKNHLHYVNFCRVICSFADVGTRERSKRPKAIFIANVFRMSQTNSARVPKIHDSYDEWIVCLVFTSSSCFLFGF